MNFSWFICWSFSCPWLRWGDRRTDWQTTDITQFRLNQARGWVSEKHFVNPFHCILLWYCNTLLMETLSKSNGNNYSISLKLVKSFSFTHHLPKYSNIKLFMLHLVEEWKVGRKTKPQIYCINNIEPKWIIKIFVLETQIYATTTTT